jgi:hypothetical protein
MDALKRTFGRGAVLPLTLGCASIAVMATLSVHDAGISSAHLLVAALVALGVAASEARPLHFAHGRERRTFTFCEGPLVVGLVISNGTLLIAGFVTGILLSQLLRRLPATKVLFNVAQYAAAAAMAVLVAVRVPGTLGVVCAILVFAVINDVAVQLVLRVTADAPLSFPLAGRALIWFLHVGAATSAAILVGQAVETSGAFAFALIAPIVLITYSQREVMRHHVSSQVLRTIAEQAVASQSADRQVMTQLLTRSAREVMAATQAEVLLLDGPRPLVVLDDEGRIHESRASEDWHASEPRFRTAFENGSEGATLGRWAGIVIGPESSPYGLLLITRDIDQEPFRDSDLDALRVLAEQGVKWLRRVDRTQQLVDIPQQQVIDLEARRTMRAQQPRIVELLSELDVLRSCLDNLTSATGGPAVMTEIEESQRRLIDALSDVLTPEDIAREEAVAVGSWNPVVRGAASV